PNTTQHCPVLLQRGIHKECRKKGVKEGNLATRQSAEHAETVVWVRGPFEKEPASGDFIVRFHYGSGMKPLGVLMLLGGGALSVFSSESSNTVTVPIELRRGHVMVPVKASGTNFSFLLDTGYGMTMMRADHAASLGLQRRGSMTIVGIAGE